MKAGIQEKQAFRPYTSRESRLSTIRGNLKRGDVKKIAESLNVSREWASKVIHGHGTSEPLLQAAELYIRTRSKD